MKLFKEITFLIICLIASLFAIITLQIVFYSDDINKNNPNNLEIIGEKEIKINNTIKEDNNLKRVNWVIREADKIIKDDQLKGINTINFGLWEDYSKDLLISQGAMNSSVRNDAEKTKGQEAAGLYKVNQKDIYVFLDKVGGSPYLDDDTNLLYTLLHEIGHHYDLYTIGNENDKDAEYRASVFAINKMKSLGYELSEIDIKYLENKGYVANYAADSNINNTDFGIILETIN